MCSHRGKYKYRYSILRMYSIFGRKVPCQELMCLKWKQQQIIEQLKFPTKFGRERDNSWNPYEMPFFPPHDKDIIGPLYFKVRFMWLRGVLGRLP